MNELDDIAHELRATRAEPSPEFARELDRRVADRLRNNRGRTPFVARLQRKGSVPVLAAAAAAAAVVVVVVVAFAVSGGDGGGAQLEVAVVPDKGAVEALGGGGEAAPQALERDSATAPAEGGLSAPEARRVAQGDPITIRYFFTAPIEGSLELAGREAKLEIVAGAGTLEIATEDLPAGTHVLEIALPAVPPYRERIEIGG